MRVLMLTQSYAPIVGGEERAVEGMSVELAARGHDVAVATLRQPGGGDRASDEGEPGVRVHRMRSSVYRLRRLYGEAERRHAPPAPDPEATLDLRRILMRERPDVVHAHNWLAHSYVPLDRRGGPAFALSLHDFALTCATKRMLYRGAPCDGPGLAKCMGCSIDHYGRRKGIPIALGTRVSGSWLRRHVDVFLPVSGAVGELCGLGGEDVFRVVPNMIRPSPPSPPPAPDDPRLAELPSEPFLLFFGDATVDKGARCLVEAYRTLAEPPPLVFVGRHLLDGLADHPGISVMGPWPHQLAQEALRRSMMTVVPSIWPEAFGLVALETAAAGKPIVASDIAGLRDIVVDGETGLLARPGDTAALAAALQRLIGDSALRARLGEAGRERALMFSPTAVVPLIEAAYRVAIERRRGGAPILTPWNS
jgi:glycosyltransferase involved in cell wall biosynthesis